MSLSARRRVSFDAPNRPSRKDRLAALSRNNNNRFTHTDNDSEDEDDLHEEERMRRDAVADEQERLLSEVNEEAEEEPSSLSKKRKQTDAEIADEYASTTKKRKPRITLQPTHLTGPNGLIRIRSDIGGGQMKRIKRKKTNPIDAAASYSRDLLQKYKSWSYGMFPGLAFEDVLSRVETFGSRREVKDCMQCMRDEVRNAHLERVFGKDVAARMVNELEAGLLQQEQQRNEVMEELDDFDSPPAAVVVPPLEASVSTQPSAPTPRRVVNTYAAPSKVSTPNSATRAIVDDSDSEAELEFDKVSSTAAISAAAGSTLFDTDDEDDENAIVLKKADTNNRKGGEDTASMSLSITTTIPTNNKAASENIATNDGSSDLVDSDDDDDGVVADNNKKSSNSVQDTLTAEATSRRAQVENSSLELEPANTVPPPTSTNGVNSADVVRGSSTARDIEVTFNANADKQRESTDPTATTSNEMSKAAGPTTPRPSCGNNEAVNAEDDMAMPQVTVLATQIESMADDEGDETQATVLASQIESHVVSTGDDVDNDVMLTQATVSTTQVELSVAAADDEQDDMTQDTVLATQIEPSCTGKEEEDMTQDTVLATQIEPSSTQVDCDDMMLTQETLLATQIDPLTSAEEGGTNQPLQAAPVPAIQQQLQSSSSMGQEDAADDFGTNERSGEEQATTAKAIAVFETQPDDQMTQATVLASQLETQ